MNRTRRAAVGVDGKSERPCSRDSLLSKVFMVFDLLTRCARGLAADGFAYVLDGLADLAFGCSISFLNVTFGATRCPLALHLPVIYRATDILFNRPFCLIEFAF